MIGISAFMDSDINLKEWPFHVNLTMRSLTPDDMTLSALKDSAMNGDALQMELYQIGLSPRIFVGRFKVTGLSWLSAGRWDVSVSSFGEINILNSCPYCKCVFKPEAVHHER